MSEAVQNQDINYQPDAQRLNFKTSTKRINKKGLFLILLFLLLGIIVLTTLAILYLNNSQNITTTGNKIGNIFHRQNPKYSDYAKKYLGPARFDSKSNRYLVSGLLDGRNDTTINVDTATGPMVFQISQDTLLEELVIYQHDSTDSATLKLNHVYTVNEFIKSVPDGSLLQVYYNTGNNINTAAEIDYIKKID